MHAAYDPVYPLNRGGSASRSAIDRTLRSLAKIQHDRDDNQFLLSQLSEQATPEKFEQPLKLNNDQLDFLRFAGLIDEAGKIIDQTTAMILTSSIALTEGEYMVFAPV